MNQATPYNRKVTRAARELVRAAALEHGSSGELAEYDEVAVGRARERQLIEEAERYAAQSLAGRLLQHAQYRAAMRSRINGSSGQH